MHEQMRVKMLITAGEYARLVGPTRGRNARLSFESGIYGEWVTHYTPRDRLFR